MSREKQKQSADRYKSLSEKQELLLSRFFDGECSAFDSYFARRLLANNRAAQNFLAALEQLKHECSGLALSQPETPTNLWDRVGARIEQEEHAARFLGNRRVEQSHISLREWLSMRHVVMGGLSGAAIAVALITVAFRPSQLLTFSAPAAGPVVGNQLVKPVGIGAPAAQGTRGSVIAVRPHNPLEVDWMRANGSLKLIPDPSGSSAIIWVRRPSKSRLTPQNTGAKLMPTPLGLIATDRNHRNARRVLLDERPQVSAK